MPQSILTEVKPYFWTGRYREVHLSALRHNGKWLPYINLGLVPKVMFDALEDTEVWMRKEIDGHFEAGRGDFYAIPD